MSGLPAESSCSFSRVSSLMMTGVLLDEPFQRLAVVGEFGVFAAAH